MLCLCLCYTILYYAILKVPCVKYGYTIHAEILGTRALRADISWEAAWTLAELTPRNKVLAYSVEGGYTMLYDTILYQHYTIVYYTYNHEYTNTSTSTSTSTNLLILILYA